MKFYLLLILIFLVMFLTHGCITDRNNSFDVLMKHKNTESGYYLIIEDYSYYYWAILYDKSLLSPLCRCFIGTTKQPLSVSEMPEPFNGNLPISVNYATTEAELSSFDKKDISIKWLKKGECVIVYLKNSPICILDGNKQKGYTKAVNKSGSYGNPWDESYFLGLNKEKMRGHSLKE